LSSERQILTQLSKRREEQTTVEGQLGRPNAASRKLSARLLGRFSVKATRGPVQAGEELLSILPNEELLLEVKVLNRDIGFIREGTKNQGQNGDFPVSEFGTIDGEVVKVSPNAIVDKELDIFTRVRLNQHSIQVRGQNVVFTPGMSATGEIVTRRNLS